MLYEQTPYMTHVPDGRYGGIPKERSYGNRELPIWDVMDDVVLNVMYDRGTILSAQTGSGKSTQVPQALYHEGLIESGKILVVQNRVAVATELAKRVAQEMGTQVGDIVGYSTGPEKLLKPSNQILFVTNGVFKHIARHDPALEQASVVIFDEFDERELGMDIGASLVAKAQERGSQVKMMVMSATLNAEKVSAFFGGLPIVESEGRQYPVVYHFAEKPIDSRDKPQAAAEKITDIHTTGTPGDVLVFMPGKQEIQQVISAVSRQKCDGMTLLPLHSELTPEERNAIFQKVKGRKVIVSTNIAERGLTIEGIKYVIDSGLARMTDYDPLSDATKLLVTICAQDALRQRAGRGGRTQPGEYHALFTQEDFNQRARATKPEIQRSTLRDVVLQIKAMGYSRENDPLKIMDSPEKTNWKSAKNQLRLLGALDPTDETTLSEFGRRMSELPCDSRDAAMLLHAADTGCLEDMIRLVGIRMSRRLLYRPKASEYEAETAHSTFLTSGTSDLFNMLKVIKTAEEMDFKYEWAKKNFVSYPALQEYRENRRRLRQELKRLGYETDVPSSGVESVLCQVIAKGFPDKIYIHDYGNQYRHRETGHAVRLGRESTVTKAEVIVANEILNTGRGEFVTVATKLK